MADRLAVAHPLLDHVAGDLQLGHVQDDHPFADARQRPFELLPVQLHVVAAEGNQPCVLHQPERLVPGRQVAQAVHAHQEEDFRVAAGLLLKQPHHVHRVVGAGTVGVDAAHPEGIDIGGGQFGHADAILHRRHAPPLLVGWVARRRQIDQVQAKLKPCLLRQDQVADVDWVEGAAQDADAARPFVVEIHRRPLRSHSPSALS